MHEQTIDGFWALTYISLASTAVGLAVVLLVELKRLSDPKVRNTILSMCVLFLSLGVLGAAAGLSGGQSRSAVVGEIYPAAFTLLGAGTAYLFGINTSRGTVVSLCALVFAISLFSGFNIGANLRNQSDEQRELRHVCLSALTDGEFAIHDKAFDRFWNAMNLKATGTSVELGHPEIKSKETQLNASTNLCASIVTQWSIPKESFQWNIKSATK